jgi:hypothetical protein
MSFRLSQLRASSTAAHVLPLMLFTLLTAVPGWFKIENPELPWYQQAPEHWVYPLQTMLCGSLLLWFRRHYQMAPWRGLALTCFFALSGMALCKACQWC